MLESNNTQIFPVIFPVLGKSKNPESRLWPGFGPSIEQKETLPCKFAVSRENYAKGEKEKAGGSEDSQRSTSDFHEVYGWQYVTVTSLVPPPSDGTVTVRCVGFGQPRAEAASSG